MPAFRLVVATLIIALAGCTTHRTSASDPLTPADRAAIESTLRNYAQSYAAGDGDAFLALFHTPTPAQVEFARAWADVAEAGAKLWPAAVEAFGEDDAATLFGVAEITPPPLAQQFLAEISLVGIVANGADRVTVGGGLAACCPFTALERVDGKWKLDLLEMVGGEPTAADVAEYRDKAAKMRRIGNELTSGKPRTHIDYLRELTAPLK